MRRVPACLPALSTGGIRALTTNALTQLAKGCLFLEELFLEDCVGITKVRQGVCGVDAVRCCRALHAAKTLQYQRRRRFVCPMLRAGM